MENTNSPENKKHIFLFLDLCISLPRETSGLFWDTRVDEVVPCLSYTPRERPEERGERKVRCEKRRRGRKAWVESRENRSTAGGTRRREVLLSGRGPLSSLSRWWQVSVAALAAEDGRYRRRRQGTFLSQLHFRLVCAAKPLRGVACPPRARRARRQATRTMSDATPGITPPPRSDATAIRYALCIRCWERVREPFPFRSFIGMRSQRELETRTLPPRWNLVCLFASPSWMHLLSLGSAGSVPVLAAR